MLKSEFCTSAMKEEGFLSCQNQEVKGDSLSLDLPDESWEGEPIIDKMYVEIQGAYQVTKQTYDLLQEKEERPACEFDLAEIMDSSPEHDLSEFCAEFIRNTVGNEFVSVSYPNGRCGGNTTKENKLTNQAFFVREGSANNQPNRSSAAQKGSITW
jgi:hypothetical protein